MFRVSGGGAAVLCATAVLVAGCAANHPAAPPAQQVRTASPVSTARLHRLAARYLTIAGPASGRLDHDVDGYQDESRHDLAAAEAELRAESATEVQFDRQLSRIPFPLPIAATAGALIAANQTRIGLTSQQARSSSLAAAVVRPASPRRGRGRRGPGAVHPAGPRLATTQDELNY
jgi:hypothetical protein